MELENSFEVERPIGEAWEVLTDLERIAPCLPGAQLTEVEGDDFRGTVKVKVGPMTAVFKGTAKFLELDSEGRVAVLEAKGRDTRGGGNASATINAQLEGVGESATRVTVVTDMKITGKFAQFGRGVLAEVSANLMDEFANNLSKMLTATDEPPAPVASTGDIKPVSDDESTSDGMTNVDGVRKIEMPEAEAIDLLSAAGTPILKRLAIGLGAVALLLLLRRLCRCCR